MIFYEKDQKKGKHSSEKKSFCIGGNRSSKINIWTTIVRIYDYQNKNGIEREKQTLIYMMIWANEDKTRSDFVVVVFVFRGIEMAFWAAVGMGTAVILSSSINV